MGVEEFHNFRALTYSRARETRFLPPPQSIKENAALLS
jgi:hypothetical protein